MHLVVPQILLSNEIFFMAPSSIVSLNLIAFLFRSSFSYVYFIISIIVQLNILSV